MTRKRTKAARDIDAAEVLSPPERRFVDEYLIDFNAGRAYMAAFPGCRSRNAAYTSASRLMQRVHVQRALTAARRAIAEALELTQERIYTETARIAFFDPRKLFDAEGRPKPIHTLDDDTAAAIAGVEVTDAYEGRGDERRRVGTVLRYRIADKNVALERAARLLGLFKVDNAQRADPLAKLLQEMRRSAFPLAPASCDETPA